MSNGEPNQCSKGRKEGGRRLAVGDCLLWSFESWMQREEKEIVLIGKGQTSLNYANLLEAKSICFSNNTMEERSHLHVFLTENTVVLNLWGKTPVPSFRAWG